MIKANHGIPKATVLKLAAISEGLLLGLACGWSLLAGLTFNTSISLPLALFGAVASLPIFIFNFGVFVVLAERWPCYSNYSAFKRGLVDPLCVNLDVPSAFFVALSSGIVEELFFRGVLDSQLSELLGMPLGIAASAAIFSYVHFVGVLRSYTRLALLYFMFGLYFSYLVILSHSLIPAMLAHSIYNFSVMIYIRYFERK